MPVCVSVESPVRVRKTIPRYHGAIPAAGKQVIRKGRAGSAMLHVQDVEATRSIINRNSCNSRKDRKLEAKTGKGTGKGA